MSSFHIMVREHTYTGRFYTDIVEAGSFEQALQLAAGTATAPLPPPGSKPRPDGADRRRCSDVWVYRLLHCEVAEGHDPPHMAVAPGYRRPMRWVRDERGLAHALPEPATGNREAEGREAQSEEPPASRSSADTVAGSTGITVPLHNPPPQ